MQHHLLLRLMTNLIPILPRLIKLCQNGLDFFPLLELPSSTIIFSTSSTEQKHRPSSLLYFNFSFALAFIASDVVGDPPKHQSVKHFELWSSDPWFIHYLDILMSKKLGSQDIWFLHQISIGFQTLRYFSILLWISICLNNHHFLF